MVHHTASSPSLAPNRWDAWRKGLHARPASSLLRYFLILAAVCAIGCLYLWQSSTISDLGKAIDQLDARAQRLEVDNAILVEQFAKWNTPAYVEGRAEALGLRLASPPVVVQVPQSPHLQGPEQAAATETRGPWQALTGLLPHMTATAGIVAP